MYLIRALSIFAAIVAVIAFSFRVREHLRRSAFASTAVVLVAEAAELCRAAEAAEAAGDMRSGGATARRAAGVEALAAAGELAERLRDRRLVEAFGEIIASLRQGCGDSGSQERVARHVSPSDRNRRALVRPYLARLNGAALEAVASAARPAADVVVREESGSGPADLPLVRVEPADVEAAAAEKSNPENPASAPVEIRTAVAEEEARNRAVQKESPTDTSSTERSSIEVSLGASRNYRRRIGRWVLVFGREAEALRVARLALQAEIDTSSVQRSVDACQSFSRVLARVSPDLGRAAPYRELALRADLMLARYRQGVTHCLKGRTAAAFAYLSEGDRAWTSLVRDSARLGRFRSASGAS